MPLLSRQRISKFEPWPSEAKLATYQSRKLPAILNLFKGTGKKHFVSLKFEYQGGGRNNDFCFFIQNYVFLINTYKYDM